MGDAYLKLKEYQEAIGAYKEVIKITSDVPKALYPKLVKINPKLVKITPVVFATGNLLQLLIDHDITFKADFSMIFADDNFKAYDNMGYAYGELKEYQKAIDAYKEAIKIKPDYHKAKRSLDSVLKQLEEQ
jgi:tetratricopeptide (TPR) repeat protein